VLFFGVRDKLVNEHGIRLAVNVFHGDLEAVKTPRFRNLHFFQKSAREIFHHDAIATKKNETQPKKNPSLPCCEESKHALDVVFFVVTQLDPVFVILRQRDFLRRPETSFVFLVQLPKLAIVLSNFQNENKPRHVELETARNVWSFRATMARPFLFLRFCVSLKKKNKKNFFFVWAMFVVKRNGASQAVECAKIVARIKNQCQDLNIDAQEIAQKVIAGLRNGIKTDELDELACETCAALVSTHLDFGVLAARIFVSNMHKRTDTSFFATMTKLYNCTARGQPAPLLANDVYKFMQSNAAALDNAIVARRDYDLDYFGLHTLKRSYLLKLEGVPVETPQFLFMRVACALHTGDLDTTIQTYHDMSLRYYIFGSPTLFNAGLPRAQLSSCFLLSIKDDSIEGIYDTLKDTALIAKSGGGQSLNIHCIRARGSYIRSTNGRSNGIVPMLEVFQSSSVYVDQGGGKRKGSLAVYLEPWHADIEAFLDLRKNNGKESKRCRELFTALWIPDLFMQRVERDEMWSLFCPSEAPGLSDVWGEEFNKLYQHYETTVAGKRMSARQLWMRLYVSLAETGTPYITMKDSSNAKSNQQHLGTIKSSNLCVEIMQLSSPSETAVCNLGSLALPRFVVENKFDHALLRAMTRRMVRHLNRVIDIGRMPTPEANLSNHKMRAIGLGVQGLQDVFVMLRMPFDSPEARTLNVEIFETMYFAACEASCELAQTQGPCDAFAGSPMSKGLFQFDLWKTTPSDRYDWAQLRQKIMQHGMTNSLCVALMPTASTSQILGNTECFEPYSSLLYIRRTLAGDFVVVCKALMQDLLKLGLWNTQLKDKIIANHGSIQDIAEIPSDLKQLYRTVWEIPQRTLVDMCADRAPFICQSQSMNIHMQDVTYQKVTSLLFHAWKRGLKSCLYYLRSRSATEPVPVTIDPTCVKKRKVESCSLEKGCVSCGG
jgi:ribonucleoside-diphosphate reductase alpha chain